MGLYLGAVNARAGVNTANTVLFQLRTNANDRLYVKYIVWTVTTAPTNAPQLLVARATATGTSSTTVAGQPADSAEVASSANLDSAWSAAPTFTTAGPFLMSVTIPTTAGSQFVWFAPDDRSRIVIPASGGLVFACANASGATVGAHALSVAWEE